MSCDFRLHDKRSFFLAAHERALECENNQAAETAKWLDEKSDEILRFDEIVCLITRQKELPKKD